MILTSLICGAAIIAGIGIIAAFWNDLISFLKKGTADGRRYCIWMQGFCEKTAGGS